MSFTRVELEFCKDFTEKLIRHPLSCAFLHPVNPQVDGLADYHEKIERPMDLGTIKSNLENNQYTNSRQWGRDVQLVWENAKKFHPRKSLLYEIAERMSQKCLRVLKLIPKTEPELWALKLNKLNQRLRAFIRESPPETINFPRNPRLVLKPE
jgi:hypothetical protein